MNGDTAVHMVMGTDEAHVINAALGILLGKLEFDLERMDDKSEQDRNEFMTLLSVKFCAEGMFDNLAELLGYTEEGR